MAPAHSTRSVPSASHREARSLGARLRVMAGYAAPLAAAAFGVGGILARTPHGAYVTPDSVSYMVSAENVLRGRGFITYNGQPYTEWPPLFPLAIAAARLLVGRTHLAAGWLNALVFGLLAASAGLWTRRRTGSLLAGAGVALACIRAAALVLVSVAVWSEPLYLLWSLLALFALSAFLRGGRRTTLVLAAALSSLAFLSRYVGIAVIGTGGLLVLFRPGATWRRRLGDTVLYGAVSTAANLAWALRNYHVAGNLSGGRRLAHVPLSHNLRLYAETLGGWLLPPEASFEVRVGTGIAVLLAGAALGYALRRWRVGGDDSAPPEIEGDDGVPVDVDRAAGDAAALVPLVAYVALYSVLLLASATLTPIDPVGDRLMVPLLVPALVAAVCAAHAAARRAASPAARIALAAAGIAALGLWMAVATGRHAEAWRMPSANGEFARRDWRRSGVGRYLRRHVPRGTLFSNDPWTLYAITGLGAHAAPSLAQGDEVGPRAAALQDYEDAQGDGPVWLVWLDRDPDLFPRTLVALGQRLAVIPVARRADGVVYSVTDQEDPAAATACVPGRRGEKLCPVRVSRRHPPR